MKPIISLLSLAVALAAAPAAAQTAAQAESFVAAAEKELLEFGTSYQQVVWINETYLTDDTNAVAALFATRASEIQVRQAKEAAKFAKVEALPEETRRRIETLRGGITLPAPTTPGAAAELATIGTRMKAAYGAGKGMLDGQPINGSDIEAAMGTERDPRKLKEMWLSWHDNVGAPMRGDYVRMVELGNRGAKELGFKDVGAMWRSRYDMPADEFGRLVDKLWGEVKPLYDELHCYTRTKLSERYGKAVQPATGPIRADLLGNMWAQEWGNIYDIVAPEGAGDIGFDTTALLAEKGYDPISMVKAGEGFFSSLGFAPLPETFWQRSQFVKPADREVVCHASAWDIDNVDDLRIKMCIKVNGDDFSVIHHELGHNYYQRAYNKQPLLFRDGANDGFHEAIGDTIALSITPDYLVKIGLLDEARVPSEDKDLGLLLKQAMDKVAFLPFGLMIDKWRWGVFSGQIRESGYQPAWDALRLQYQGVVPPVERDGKAFDPGAKFHIPASVPYARYFLARILQFQFYKAACEQAGWTGPLHRCSFFDDKTVGAKLNAMLEMGASKPWPDALEAFTGERAMSGEAMIAYFQPLMDWMKEQNAGKRCGW